MRKVSKVGLGVVGAVALIVAQAVPAQADPSAGPADIVGIGSDTLQYAGDFLADGDYLGNPGFNAAGGRVFNLDATGDASGKLTAGATVVLRGGTFPVVRPNGSGAGLTYFLNTDTAATHKVQFVRSSRAPSQAEKDKAVTNGWGGLHCYQMGLDGLQIAVSKLVATNVPAAGLSVSQLAAIYSDPNIDTWSQVPGYSGPNGGATIAPVIPQAGSGTRSFFLSSIGLTEAQVRTDTTLVVVEEHDPAPIQNNANAFGPFSTARKAMINNGYFNNGTAQDPITLQAPPTNANAFSVTRPIWIVVRQSEVSASFNTKLFAPGGFMSQSILAAPLIQDAAGFTYQYRDAGTACA